MQITTTYYLKVGGKSFVVCKVACGIEHQHSIGFGFEADGVTISTKPACESVFELILIHDKILLMVLQRPTDNAIQVFFIKLILINGEFLNRFFVRHV